MPPPAATARAARPPSHRPAPGPDGAGGSVWRHRPGTNDAAKATGGVAGWYLTRGRRESGRPRQPRQPPPAKPIGSW